MKRKNPAGIQSRVNQHGVIELWVGTPDEPESDCIAQFSDVYLESVKHVLDNINKSPKYDGNINYGVRR